MFCFSQGWELLLTQGCGQHLVFCICVCFIILLLFRDLKLKVIWDLSSSFLFCWMQRGTSLHIKYKIFGPLAVSDNEDGKNHSHDVETMQWKWIKSAGRCSFYFIHSEWHISPKVVIQTLWFTVKSADSGIQNSADGSREMLATTPSNNSLTDAGKTHTHAVRGGRWGSSWILKHKIMMKRNLN